MVGVMTACFKDGAVTLELQVGNAGGLEDFVKKNYLSKLNVQRYQTSRELPTLMYLSQRPPAPVCLQMPGNQPPPRPSSDSVATLAI